MALDGLAVAALVSEMKEKLVNLRIDKIHQPEHDELHITFHGFGQSYKLLLTAHASIARACLTKQSKQNPTTPPMFCMLLRKVIGGGKLVGIEQPDFERVIKFYIESYDEMGDKAIKTLVIEIMGRHSNIMLVDEHNKILDSIKRVDFSVSTVRQVLPGLQYENPPSQNKKNPLFCNTNDIIEILKTAQEGDKLSNFILSAYTGISPLVAREISYRTVGDVDIHVSELNFSQLLDVATGMFQLFKEIKEEKFKPCYIENIATKKPIDFSVIEITQYGYVASVEYRDSISEVIDRFYLERDRKERMTHRSANLVKLLSNHMERCSKKLELQIRELADTDKKDKYKQYGELITANIYRIEQGMEHLVAENYYEDHMPTVTIPLKKDLTPSQNAQRYFKKYNKAKTAQIQLTKQIEIAKSELAYLETVEEELSKATNEQDLADISMELSEQGYLKRQVQGKGKKKEVSQPMSFVTSDGFSVLVGKNNKQNDLLTMKLARNNDLWFHTKNIPGSHVVLKYEYEKEFSDRAISEAASLAAYYSKAKNSDNVPVDYTEIKNVKKPSGAKPGFVIYTNNQTEYVMPKADLTQN